MTTVSTLVADAMFAARVLGQDQTATSGDTNLVLRCLNRMLDSWANEKQMVFTRDSETFSTVAGQQAYLTSVLAAGRPIAIDAMRLTLSGVDYEVEPVDVGKWNSISVKTVSSIPSVFFYDAAYPNASIFFYPIPYAVFTATVYAQRVLAAPLAMATNLAMPPGYEAAIVAGLAVEMWGFFKSTPMPALMMERANYTRAVLKRTNYTPLEMSTGMGGGNGSAAGYLPQW